MSEIKGLCPTCDKAIWCPTWGEWRCKAHEKRIYNYAEMTECESYKKRGKDFEEPQCLCEDCLHSELLNAEIEEV